MEESLVNDFLEILDIYLDGNTNSQVDVLKNLEYIIENDGIRFVTTASWILNSQGYSNRIILGTFVFLNLALTPKSRSDLELIRNQWFLNEGLRNSIVESVYNYIKSSQNDIRNCACKSFSLIIGLELDRGLGFAQSVIELMKGFQCAEDVIGAIIAFHNLFFLKNFNEELHTEGFWECFLSILDESIRLIGSENVVVNETIRIEAATFISDSMKFAPDLITGPETAIKLIESMKSSLIYGNVDLYLNLHIIMYQLIKSFYQEYHMFMEDLFPVIMNGFASRDPVFLSVTLEFWLNLSQFERNYSILQQNDEGIPISPSSICISSIEVLFPVLIELIINRNDNSTSTEVIGEDSLFSKSAVIIQTIFGIDKNQVLAYLSDAIQALLTSNVWQENNAGCYLVSCVSDPFDPHFLAPISDYLWKVYNFFGSSIPRLVESSMWAFHEIIKSYGAMIFANGNIIEFVENLINNMVFDNETEPIFVLRFAKIITFICRSFSPYQSRNPINELFDLLYCFIKKLYMYEPLKENDNLAYNISESLNSLVISSPNDRNTSILSILIDINDLLKLSFISFDSSNQRYVFQAALCSNINIISSRLGSLPGIVYDDVISTLFHILSNRNQILYDEALLTISVVLIKRGKFIEDEMSHLLELVSEALDTNSTTLIDSCCVLLSRVFTHFLKLMHHYSLDIFKKLVNMLSIPDVESSYPRIIVCIADVINSIMNNSEECLIPEAEGVLNEIIIRFSNQSIDVESENSLEFGSQVFTSVAYTLNIYSRTFFMGDGSQKEKDELLLLSKLSSNIMKTKAYSEELIIELCKMFESFSSFCSKRHNCILNRFNNVECLKFGKIYRSQISRIESTIKKMKST